MRVDTGNLSELSTLVKGNNQFIIMGSEGTVTSRPMNKSAVGLGSVDNTSDANKPISTATQTALNGKLNLTGGTMSGGLDFAGTALRVRMGSASLNRSYSIFANVSDAADYGFIIQRDSGNPIVTFGVGGSQNVAFSGNISKAGGTFDIDHPKDPYNKNLRHGFVEAPEYLNIYRGTANMEGGRATVNIDSYFGMSDGTFAALNTDIMISLLNNKDGFERVKGSIDGGTLTIECEDSESSASIDWIITGRRNDAYVVNLDPNCERGTGRFIPEYDKEDA